MVRSALDATPAWSFVGKFGGNRLLRSAYFWLVFVPIADRVLENVGNIFTISLFGKTYDLVIALPFSWQMFYFCDVFIGIANLLYAFRCPRLIRDYSKYEEFERTGQGGA